MMMKLVAGAWQLTLRPDQGGIITSLEHRGSSVLRPMAEDRKDALDSACFALVPYANRIAGGRFTLHGNEYRLPLNFGDHPHTLHGTGWQRPWDVESAAPDQAELAYRHEGEAGWPWRYQATQRLTLSNHGLEATLTVINEAEQPMPCGLGFHPYFASAQGTRLQFDAKRVWHYDDTMLPTEPDSPDRLGNWSSGASVSGDFLIDNAYEDWAGAARIEHGDGRAFQLSATGAPWLHLYRPPGESFFCAEPVNHGPDAINRGGMPMLDPGATQSLTMAIALV